MTVAEKLEGPVKNLAGASAAKSVIRQGAGTADQRADGAAFADVMAAVDGEVLAGAPQYPMPQNGSDASVSAPTTARKSGAAWGTTRADAPTLGQPLVPEWMNIATERTSSDSSFTDGNPSSDQGAGHDGVDVTKVDVTKADVVVTGGSACCPGAPVALALPIALPMSPVPVASMVQPQVGVIATAKLNLPSVSTIPNPDAPSSPGDPLVSPDASRQDGLITVIAQERHLASATFGPSLIKGAAPVSAALGKADIKMDTLVMPGDTKGHIAQAEKKLAFVPSELARPVAPPRIPATATKTLAGATVDSFGLKDRPVVPVTVPVPVAQATQSGPAVPVLPVAVCHQVIAAIEQTGTTALNGSTGTVPLDGTQAQNPSSDSVRVLVVKLQPAELGTVMVRLSLKGETLSVAMSADEHRTTAILDSQRGLLADELKTLGHRIGDISVTLASNPEPISSGRPATSNTASPSAQGGENGSSGGGSRAGSQGQGSPRQQIHVPLGEIEGAESENWRSPARTGSGLFL